MKNILFYNKEQMINKNHKPNNQKITINFRIRQHRDNFPRRILKTPTEENKQQNKIIPNLQQNVNQSLSADQSQIIMQQQKILNHYHKKSDETCLFTGIFPLKKDIKNFIRLDDTKNQTVQNMVAKLEQEAQQMFPTQRITYRSKSRKYFIKYSCKNYKNITKKRIARQLKPNYENKQPIVIQCFSSDYNCKAKLIYNYDEQLQCFILTECNNEHAHYYYRHYFNTLKQMCKNKNKKIGANSLSDKYTSFKNYQLTDVVDIIQTQQKYLQSLKQNNKYIQQQNQDMNIVDEHNQKEFEAEIK